MKGKFVVKVFDIVTRHATYMINYMMSKMLSTRLAYEYDILIFKNIPSHTGCSV